MFDEVDVIGLGHDFMLYMSVRPGMSSIYLEGNINTMFVLLWKHVG